MRNDFSGSSRDSTPPNVLGELHAIQTNEPVSQGKKTINLRNKDREMRKFRRFLVKEEPRHSQNGSAKNRYTL